MTQRILIVDDEPGICHVLKSVLLDEGYYVDTAMSAKEALGRLAVAPFDLAIVDLYLPGVNGLQLAEAIRFLDPQTPVVLMTAYGTTAFEVMASHPAITAYVHKPFELDAMLAVIRRTALRRPPSPS
jgi:DNA-binding response OmpR family regulator